MSDYEDSVLSALPSQYVFEFIGCDELDQMPQAEWLVEDVLPAQGVAVIYGASGSGKTFLTLDLGLAVAGGNDWFGSRTEKCTPVAYCPLESGTGISKRLQAWRRRAGELAEGGYPSCPTNFKILKPQRGSEVNLTDDLNVEALGANVIRTMGKGALVILDTFNRATAGIDENSGKDVGIVIRNALRLQELTGGLVLLIHHSGKDSARGMRGHSSLAADVATVIEVSKDISGAAKWRLTKSKDGESNGEKAFRLRKIELGINIRGRPIDSCVVEWNKASVPAPKGLGLGKNQTLALDAIKARLPDGLGNIKDVPPGFLALAYADALARTEAALAAEGVPRPAERSKEAIKGLIERDIVRQVGSTLVLKKQYIWIP